MNQKILKQIALTAAGIFVFLGIAWIIWVIICVFANISPKSTVIGKSQTVAIGKVINPDNDGYGGITTKIIEGKNKGATYIVYSGDSIDANSSLDGFSTTSQFGPMSNLVIKKGQKVAFVESDVKVKPTTFERLAIETTGSDQFSTTITNRHNTVAQINEKLKNGKAPIQHVKEIVPILE